MQGETEHMHPVSIGHGSPMNAIAGNAYADFLARYAKSIPAPEAVVVISAHWRTRGTYITGNDDPEQIYDFYGFPEALYQVKYAPPGSRAVAERIFSEVPGIEIEPERGIDHAGWAVVKHMYPDRNIPLLEMSLDIDRNPRQHFMLGQLFKKFKYRGILFIGSGNLVHNLRDISFDEHAIPFRWAAGADAWLDSKIRNGEIDQIIHYEQFFPEYRRAIPTDEHFLPLLYILGMHDSTGYIRTLYEEIQNGSISMRSIEVE